MSIHMCVFFSGPLPSQLAVQHAMHDFGLPFEITDLTRGLDSYGAFMPMTSGEEEETGTEVYVDPARERIKELSKSGVAGIDPAFDRAISFRFGGDFMECSCAYALSAAIAKLTGGAIYDDSEGAVIPIDTALHRARKCMDIARNG